MRRGAETRAKAIDLTKVNIGSDKFKGWSQVESSSSYFVASQTDCLLIDGFSFIIYPLSREWN